MSASAIRIALTSADLGAVDEYHYQVKLATEERDKHGKRMGSMENTSPILDALEESLTVGSWQLHTKTYCRRENTDAMARHQ